MRACPQCGEENPERARFCSSCGVALREMEPSGAEERKVVSVLFVDLVGFTARSDRADPEDVRATLRPYHARLKQEIERFGGTVEKFIGDAVMAVFGAPVSHEDDAERAVRAALRILDAIQDLNAEEGVELAVRAAVATGEAVVSLDARPEMGEGIATGDVVNTAARLQQAAPVGSVVVGESTYRSTRDVILYDELEPVSVKGKAEPLQLWQATRSRGRFGIDVERRADVPFIGREHELALLKDAYARAMRESSLQLVTMTGEPGVGKTRLIAEFLGFVDAQPELVLWRQGRCLPYGEGITFWALGEIVKAHAGILESDSPTDAGAKLGAAIDGLIEDETDRDWFRGRLAPLIGAETSEVAVAREESFTAWQRFLEAVAAQRPLVLVVEDLHWADAALVDFLDHLVDWSSGVPLVLLIAARPELYERHPGWGGGKRNSVTISLGPLTDEETARLVASLVGRSVLPAETQAALLERAGGNPLYAEEFVRMLAERGPPAPDAPLPENVQALIAARLDTLPAERKSLLQDASVVGKVFWTGAVAAIGSVDERTVKEGMRELVRKELVRPTRTTSVEGQDELSFWHALVRDVAYQQLPRAARAAKHLAAAKWIEGIAGDRVADQAEILVHHVNEALELRRAAGSDTGQDELEDRLRTFLIMAGERATQLDAHKAYDYFHRALELSRPDQEGRADLLEQAGLAAGDTGRGQEAWELRVQALEEARESGDPLRTGKLLGTLAHAHWMRGHQAEFERYLREGLDLLEREPPGPELAYLYSRVAAKHMVASRSRECLEASQKALALCEEFGVHERTVTAMQSLGIARCELGDLEGLEDLRAGIRRGLELGLGTPTAIGYTNLGHFLWLMEGPRQAIAAKEEGDDFSRRRGLEGPIGWNRSELVWMLFDLGEWDELIEIADERIAWAREGGRFQTTTMVHTYKAIVLALRGRLAEAAALREEFLPQAREAADPQVLVPALTAAALIEEASGNLPAALELVVEVELATRDRADWTRLLHAPICLRISVAADAVSVGEQLLDRPNARGARLEPALVAGRAIVAEARGEIDEAETLYADAAKRWEKYEFPFEQAHALLGHWRCTGDETSLGDGRAIFERLGAVVPQATAEESARAARRAK
jgi:class 3 adenylate cyclase/tetratricopeptide (TPR) repeat protein